MLVNVYIHTYLYIFIYMTVYVHTFMYCSTFESAKCCNLYFLHTHTHTSIHPHILHVTTCTHPQTDILPSFVCRYNPTFPAFLAALQFYISSHLNASASTIISFRNFLAFRFSSFPNAGAFCLIKRHLLLMHIFARR